MRRVGFNECDTAEEVCGWLNKIFDNMNQMEAKIVQNAQEIEALKKKGKRKMKSNGSVLTRVMALLIVVVVMAGLCYAAYVPGDINYDIASNPESLSIYLRDVTNNMRSNTYVFTPRAAAPAIPAEGMVYYNSGTDTWVGYTDPGGWLNFDVAGGVNLNGAYDFGAPGAGATILANDGAVVISNAEADAADLLQLTYTGAAAGRALVASVNGTEPVIEIENTGTGYDIEGTGATWYATDAGVIVGVSGDLTGAAGLTLENDETITNPNGSITFTVNGGNTLIFDLDDGATSILIDSGDVVTLDWGTVDNFTSVETIVFDDAAASITQTGTGTNNLTIAQVGAVDNSLILSSSGTATDALDINATVGGIDVDSALSIVLTSVEDTPDSIVLQSTLGGIDILCDAGGAGHDIDIAATGSSVNITSTEDAASAITLTTNGGVSETIVVTNTQGTGADAITITGTAGGIDVDAVDDINIAVASTAGGDDLALVQTGGVDASITLAAAGTGADAIDLNASAGGIDIDAAAAITFDNAAGDITIASAAGSLNLTGGQAAVDAVVITSGGGMDVVLVDDLDLTLTSGAADENLSIVLAGATASSIIMSSTGTGADAIDIDTTAGGIDIDIAGAAADEDFAVTTNTSIVLAATENAADSIVLQSTLGGIDIRADASGDEDIDISNTGGNVHIVSDAAATDAFDLDVTGANGGVDIDTTDGPIHLVTAGAINGDISIDSSDEILIISSDAAAAGITIQTDGGAAETIYINSTAGTSAAAINIDADAGGITLLADGAVAGDILIDAEDKITIVSYDQDADGIDIGVPATGHANSTIHVHNETGTAVDSIEILTDAGGVTVTSNLATADGINLNAIAGGVDIDGALQVNIASSQAAATAIVINASAGGFDIDGTVHASTITQTATGAADDLTISQVGNTDSHLILESAGTSIDSIYIHESGAGTGGGILLHSDTGIGVSAASASVASIQLLSDDGGIGLLSNANLANAIRIEADGGALETVVISSIKGTDAASVNLDSLVGGVTISTHAAAKDIIVNSVLGTISLLAEETGAAQAMSIIADGDATTGVWIQSISGTSVTEDSAALEIQATAGGIQIKSDADLVDAIVIRADGGGTAEMLIVNDQGIAVDSIEIESLVGGITLTGGADDNITMTTGAAGGAAGNVVFTNGQTRAHYIQVRDVDLDVTNPPTLTSNGTDARWRSATLEFDADPGGNDDVCYIQWVVPAGYIANTANLHVYWSFDTAEDAADECTIDGTVSAIGAGEDLDVAGTVMAAVASVITDASAEEGSLVKTSLDIEVEDIVVDDMVTIMFFFDESACLMANSGTADVHYFVITYESSE